jgi:hypothetical protein
MAGSVAGTVVSKAVDSGTVVSGAFPVHPASKNKANRIHINRFMVNPSFSFSIAKSMERYNKKCAAAYRRGAKSLIS